MQLTILDCYECCATQLSIFNTLLLHLTSTDNKEKNLQLSTNPFSGKSQRYSIPSCVINNLQFQQLLIEGEHLTLLENIGQGH